MTFDDFKQMRWLSIYGAMIALQVRDRMRDGRGPPEESDMVHFIEEAGAVADVHDEVEAKRLKGIGIKP